MDPKNLSNSSYGRGYGYQLRCVGGMLERVAFHLEGGGWRLLRGRLKRRMLHSAFWTHGAGELDLSAAGLFGFGLSGTDPEVTGRRHDGAVVGSRRGTSHDAARGNGARFSAEIQLDFLYPWKTLAFLRHLTIPLARDDRETMLSRAALSRACKRLYSSKSPGKGPREPRDPKLVAVPLCISMDEDNVPIATGFATFDGFKAAGIRGAFDSLWYHYVAERNDGDRGVKRERRSWAIAYLEQSTRDEDKERIVAIVQDVAPEERLLDDYQSATDSLMALKYPQNVLAFLQDIVSHSGYPLVGYKKFMFYCIQEGLWDIAGAALKIAEQRPSRLDLRTLPPDKMCEFRQKILDFAGTVEKNSDSEHIAQELLFVVMGSFRSKDDMKEFWKVWDFARSRGLVRQAGAYAIALVQLYRQRNFTEAVKLYREFRELPDARPSAKIFNGILRAFRNLLDFRGMQMVVDDWFALGSQPDKQAYYLLMTEMARHGETRVVKEMLDQFLQRFEPQELLPFISVMQAHTKRGELEEVVKFFDEIPKFGLVQDVSCYNVLINAYRKAEDVDGALERVQQMIKAGIPPDKYTYGTLMALASSRGDVENTKRYFDLAVDSGVRPTEPMYLAMISAYVAIGDIENAEAVLQSVQWLTPKINSTAIWNEVFSFYAWMCDPEKLSSCYRRMREAKVPFDEYTYGVLMHSLCLIGKVEAAEQVLGVLGSEGMTPNSVHYAIIMVAHMREMDLSKVWAVFNKMLEEGIQPTFTTQAVLLQASAFADHAKWRHSGGALFLDSAERILAQVTANLDVLDLLSMDPVKSATPPWLFAPLVSIYGKEGSYQRAQDIFQRFLDISEAQKPGGTHPSMILYVALMNAHMKAHNTQAVLVVWEQVKYLAAKLAKPADEGPSEKRALWSRRHMLCKPLSILIQALTRAGDLEPISKAVSELAKAGYELDNANWNNYIQAALRCGNPMVAMEVFERKLMPGWASRERGSSPEFSRFYPFLRTFDSLATVLKDLDNLMRGGDQEAAEMLKKLEVSFPRTWAATVALGDLEERVERELSYRSSQQGR